MDKIAAAAIEYVFVKARGLNNRPSCCSKENTGRNETTITNSEKNIAGPTSLEDSIITVQ